MKVWVLLFLVSAVYAKHEQYIGWKSYYVVPSSYAELVAVHSLKNEFELDFLSYPSVNREGITLVKPEHQEGLARALDRLGVKYGVHVHDVKAALDSDDEKIEQKRKSDEARNGGRNLPYDNYQTWGSIISYLADTAERFPEVVNFINAGMSFENRPVWYFKVSKDNFRNSSKPVIIIDAGIHAREWISIPTVTYAIRKLVEDVTEPDLLDNFDWILIPVVNPDGYVFTHTTNRFWRKTRSTDTAPTSFLCPGVDGNRNYDFEWNTVGTSNNPCSDTYAGNRSFSEVETQYIRDILHDHLDRTALYLTMHSFGSMILYPWGHDGSLSSNALNLHTVGIAMADAINRNSLSHFPNYVVGNSVQVIGYAAAGAAEDYAHSIGIPFAYTYELPGLSSGLQGFALDPRYIRQVVEETWEGIVAGARRAGELYNGVIVP